eukprot:NODE_611_length_5423_cov_0.857250.p2 type:complete len:298 gc:universal NODE_611_length_5423_cov_0.857250:1346-453(-)
MALQVLSCKWRKWVVTKGMFLEEFKDHLELDFVEACNLKVLKDSIIIDDRIIETKRLNLDSCKLTGVKGGLRLIVFYEPVLAKPKYIKRQRVNNVASIKCKFCDYLLADTSHLLTSKKPWDGFYESLSECFCHKTPWKNPALSNEDLMDRNKLLLSDFDIWLPGNITSCPQCKLDLGHVHNSFSMLWKWKVSLTDSLNYSLSDCMAEYLHSASQRGDFTVCMATASKCTAIQIINIFSNVNSQRSIKFLFYPTETKDVDLPLDEDIYSQILYIFRSNMLLMPIDKRLNNNVSFLALI